VGEQQTTHLLVLFDDAGRITSFGEIDQEEMDREGFGNMHLSAEGRYFAQLELTDDLRSASAEDIMTQYIVSHLGGSNPRIVRRGNIS
jgi:hypothetical protein